MTKTLPDRQGNPLYHIVSHDLYMEMLRAYVNREVTSEDIARAKREVADPTTVYISSAAMVKKVAEWNKNPPEFPQ